MYNKRKFLNILIIIVALVALSFGGYFYYKLHKLESSDSKNAETVISKVSKLYLLPENENPTIATVSDPQALKDQNFFTLSEKGDKVLIFPKAGLAILYRPGLNKIIQTISVKNNLKVNK